MAKSLRASSKLKARNARRYTPGSDYQVANAARINALSQRLMSRMKGKEKADGDEDSAAIAETDAKDADGKKQVQNAPESEVLSDYPTATTAEGAAAMDADQSEGEKKISTSGTRGSRRETWRKAKGWKPKSGGSKNGGKPKRRR
jgi:hypothetical protein